MLEFHLLNLKELNMKLPILVSLFSMALIPFTGVTQEAENKPLTVLKNNNKPFSSGYFTNDNHGWAFFNYTVDAEAKLTGFEIINASDFRDMHNEVARFLSNLEFSPAMVSGKPTAASRSDFYRLKFHSIKTSQTQVTKQFYKGYELIQSLLDSKDLKNADAELENIAERRVKNWVEQAMYYWQKTQLHFHKNDWYNYGNSMDDVLSLSEYLPAPISVIALQNAIEWYVHDKDYPRAKLALKRLEQVENVVLDDKTKQEYTLLIENPINDESEIKVEKRLDKGNVFFRKLVRNSAVIELKKGSFTQAQLRCANGLAKPLKNKDSYIFERNAFKNCHILLRTDEPTNFVLTQKS